MGVRCFRGGGEIADPVDLSGRLRLGGERRGEEAAGQTAEKHSSRHHRISSRAAEGEGRPPAQLALDPDPALVQLNELLRQGQPKPGAFQLSRGPHLAKLLEDGPLILRGNPDALILRRSKTGARKSPPNPRC